jgi:hypothetical protein
MQIEGNPYPLVFPFFFLFIFYLIAFSLMVINVLVLWFYKQFSNVFACNYVCNYFCVGIYIIMCMHLCVCFDNICGWFYVHERKWKWFCVNECERVGIQMTLCMWKWLNLCTCVGAKVWFCLHVYFLIKLN